LIDQRIGYGTPDSYNFGIIINQDSIGEINISTPAYNSSTWDMECYCADLNNNGWHNIVIIKNSGNEKVICYLDGSEIMNKSIVDCNYSISGTFLIGKNYIDDRYYEGYFDDLCIFDRALTNTEINALYHYNGW
jgi:hypothetical protein